MAGSTASDAISLAQVKVEIGARIFRDDGSDTMRNAKARVAAAHRYHPIPRTKGSYRLGDVRAWADARWPESAAAGTFSDIPRSLGMHLGYGHFGIGGVDAVLYPTPGTLEACQSEIRELRKHIELLKRENATLLTQGTFGEAKSTPSNEGEQQTETSESWSILDNLGRLSRT